MSKTVFVSIGNSDNRLTQEEWSDFYKAVDSGVRAYAKQVHGAWVSESTQPYQNACWAVTLFGPYDHTDYEKVLREQLIRCAGLYKQDSIMWAESEPEFLKGAK